MFVAFITATIVFWVVATNAVVLLVLYKAPKLRTVPNILVGNLAFSDLMIGLLILPLSAWYTVTNRWTFGKVMCELWLVSDILICTVSIWNLAIIGLDRYWAITSPVQYIKKRTFRVAVKMIVGVYVISAVISIPPYLGWKYVTESGNYVRRHNATDRFDCVHFDDQPAFSIVSATGSFWVPLILMFFFYYKIFKAYNAYKRRHAYRHNVEKEIQKQIEPAVVPVNLSAQLDKVENCISIIGNDHEIHECDVDINRLHIEPCVDNYPDIELDANSNKSAEVKQPMLLCTTVEYRHNSSSSTVMIGTKDSSDRRASSWRSFSLRIGNARDRCSNDMLDCPKYPSCASVSNVSKAPTPVCRQLLRIGKNSRLRKSWKSTTSAIKEKRGIKVLGIILGVFALCWIPFFSIYLVEALCHDCHVDWSVYNALLWLGYINSTLNPVVYTIFNREYQIALRKLLKGKLSSTTTLK